MVESGGGGVVVGYIRRAKTTRARQVRICAVHPFDRKHILEVKPSTSHGRTRTRWDRRRLGTDGDWYFTILTTGI